VSISFADHCSDLWMVADSSLVRWTGHIHVALSPFLPLSCPFFFFSLLPFPPSPQHGLQAEAIHGRNIIKRRLPVLLFYRCVCVNLDPLRMKKKAFLYLVWIVFLFFPLSLFFFLSLSSYSSFFSFVLFSPLSSLLFSSLLFFIDLYIPRCLPSFLLHSTSSKVAPSSP
jgi:hypothetical protein